MTPMRASIVGAAMFRNQQERLDCGLPLFGVVFCLAQFSDVERGVAERDKLATARQRDRIIEWPFPALGCVTRRDQRPPA
jgi:hypothetical protein